MADLTTAKGYAISDTNNYTNFSVQEFPLKKLGPRDVTIEIMFCGVCGSDVHTITGGWGPLSSSFIVAGHEVVGKVLAVGKEAESEFKVGDIAGVGAQVYSCLDCDRCKNDNENYCPQQVDTYNAAYPDKTITQGGYSTHIRADKQFVFPIPKELDPSDAAPMLCAGATVFSPLVRNDVGPGKLVGIVGMGGLGHFAVQFAKALGAKVIVFGHSVSKAADAIRLGADEYISTNDKNFASKFGAGKGPEFDFILSCADANKIPLGEFFGMLKVHGKFNTVGIPDEPFEMAAFDLVPNGTSFAASHIGSKKEILQMLKLAAEKGIKPIIPEILPMSQAAKAIEAVKNNTARYRYVLKQDLL